MQCRRSSDGVTVNLVEAASAEQMARLVETHAYRDEPYVDGRHSGSPAFVRGVRKLLLRDSFCRRRIPPISLP